MSSNALAIFADIIVFVALPVLVIWLIMRAKINKDNAQKEFMMTALEKNPQINIESLARTLDAGGKSIKEKLINKFTWGCILGFVGLAIIIVDALAMILRTKAEHGFPFQLYTFMVIGGVIAAVGIAFIVNFLVGRKLLAKEIEAEMEKDSQE